MINLLNFIAKFNLIFLIWLFSGFAALFFRYDGVVILTTYIRIVPSALFLSTFYQFYSFIDQRMFGRAKRTTSEELFSILRRYFFSGLLYFILLLSYPIFFLPKSFAILTTILALGLHLISRKLFSYFVRWLEVRSSKVPVALYGAGNQALSVIQKILADDTLDWKPVVILDDNLKLNINSINGIKIVKGLNVEDLIYRFKPKILIVTFPNISNSRLDDLQNLCNKFSVQLRIISPIKAMSGQDFKLSDIRKPTQEELIGKSAIRIRLEEVNKLINNKVVLITGAGGSIGSELARQVCMYNPKKLLLLDRDESSLLETYLSLSNLSQVSEYILVDIRDHEAVSRALYDSKPDILFHAAALKHLNMLEKFPDEGIKTNIHATNLILRESIKIGVQIFVNISTDKAADPISVLGKTKLIAERLTSHYSKQTGNENSKYVSVRFGNVFGSRGSVLQTFQKQIDLGNTITITHPNVSRYFMTMEEAVLLVLRATIEGESGDTLILKMGEPILIQDIAKKLISSSGKNIDIKYSELQPGEKLNETLVGAGEKQLRTNVEGIIKVQVEPISPLKLPLNFSDLNDT
jgi:dTDP-glucose 4,6-dehydratase